MQMRIEKVRVVRRQRVVIMWPSVIASGENRKDDNAGIACFTSYSGGASATIGKGLRYTSRVHLDGGMSWTV